MRKVGSPHPVALGCMSSEITPLARPLRNYVYPVAPEEVISFFPQKKRKLYLRELRSLSAFPLIKKDILIKAFVKNEKLKILEKDGDPRMIQARSPRFNLMLGSYTRPIEKALYHLRDHKGEKYIVKGLNSQQRANLMWSKWQRFKRPAAVSGDLSRWDMHVHLSLVELAHKFYQELNPDPLLKDLLKAQLRNKGVTSDGLWYSVDGSVMSGDMTTALGNCVLVVLILETFRKLTLTEKGRADLRLLDIHVSSPIEMAVVDDGDDHVIMVEETDVPEIRRAIPRWFEMCGHEYKVEGYTTNFHEILFCQSKPLLTKRGWDLVPDPHKVLATAFVATGSITRDRKMLKQYLGTVWEARAILHLGVPVMGPLFQRLAQANKHRLSEKQAGELVRGLSQQLERILEMYALKRRKLVYGPILRPSPEERVQLWEAWGITPDDQERLESLSVPFPSLGHIPTVRTLKPPTGMPFLPRTAGMPPAYKLVQPTIPCLEGNAYKDCHNKSPPEGDTSPKKGPGLEEVHSFWSRDQPAEGRVERIIRKIGEDVWNGHRDPCGGCNLVQER